MKKYLKEQQRTTKSLKESMLGEHKLAAPKREIKEIEAKDCI